MSNDIFAKGLAPALGCDADQVVQYVDKVLELALEELLLNGTVTLAGIGTLKRIYHPSEAREREPGKLYLVPPSQSVELVASANDDDFVYETALGRFNMDEAGASRFSKGVALTIQKVIDAAGEFDLGTIGMLKKNGESKVDLIPSDWLAEMLNKSYSHLEPAPISSPKQRAAIQEKPDRLKPEPLPEPPPASAGKPVTEEKPILIEATDDNEPEIEKPSVTPPSPTVSEAPEKRVDDLSEPFVPAFTPSSSSAGEKPAGNKPDEPTTAAQPGKKSEEEEHAWLFAEPKKDYSPYYITLGVIALVAVIIGMAIVMFSGNNEAPPVKDIAKNEQPLEPKAPPPSETAEKQTAPTKQDAPADAQEPPANKSEKPVVPPPSEIEQPKPEPSKPAQADTEPAKPLATDKKPQGASPWAVPVEFTRKVDLNKGIYSISVGSFPDKAVAQKVAGDYQKKGMTTTLWEVDVKGTVYNRVLIGSFSSQDEARAAIKKNKSLLPQGAFPVTVK